MNGNIILDTNIIIALFKNETKIVEKLSGEKNISIPVIVIGELYFGIYNSRNKEENINKLDELISTTSILSIDEITAECYGKIKIELKRSGTPIPENDIWIAALGKQFEMKIITRDNHFEKIKNLSIEQW